MAQRAFRFKIIQYASGVWGLMNEWTGETVSGYATRYAAVQARERLEYGPIFYDEGDLEAFITAEKSANRL